MNFDIKEIGSRALAFLILSILSLLTIMFIFYYFRGVIVNPFDVIIDLGIRVKEKNFSGLEPMFITYNFIAIFLPLLAFSPRGLTVKGEYGKASWANMRTIKKMKLLADRGTLLGFVGLLSRTYLRFEEALSTLVLAPPGTGKTSSIVIPNLIVSRESIIATDIKGELYELTSGYREEFSKVLRFSPAHRHSCNWNPFHIDVLPSEWPLVIQYVERIAFALMPRGKNTGGAETQDHFMEEGRAMFQFFALYLIATCGFTSLPDIRKFSLSHLNLQEWIKNLIEDEPELPDRIREEAVSLANKADKEFSGVFSSYKSKMNIFADEITADNLRENDFTFEEFRKKICTLYVTIQLRDMERYAPLIRLMYELAAYEFQAEEPKDDEQSIHFLADEFVRLGKVDQLIKIPSVGRSYRLKLTAIAQDYAQIDEVYGEGARKVLNNTVFAKVIFPQTDPVTADEICNKIIGKETRIKTGRGESNRTLLESTSRSKNESIEGHNLIEPQELLSMNEDQLIIIVRGFAQNPIMCKPLAWYKDYKIKTIVNKYKREIKW